MSADQPTVCAIGLTPETLSQWRDHVLDATTTRAVAQHIGSCATCQDWLQSFAATAQAVRQRHVPPTGASLWRGVQQRIATAERRRHRPTQIWSGLGAAVAAVLIGALFAYAVHNHTGVTSQPAASPTTPAPIALQWRQATTPPGIDRNTITLPMFAFTAYTSQTAYVCFPGGNTDTLPQVWVTRDGGATNWQQRASPPGAGALDGCALVVDSNDANALIATVGAPKFDGAQSSFSLNGGQTWQSLANWTYGIVTQSATWHNVTYLLGGNRLGVTHDNWRTWTLLDGRIAAAGEKVAQFWLDPATGEILALGQNAQDQAGATTGHLWTSVDGGQSWTELALTPTFDDGAVFALPPAAGQAWQICGQHNDNTAGNVHPFILACSADGGQSWQARAPLERTSNGLYVANERLIGLAHDGTVIEETGTSAGYTLYRQAKGATTWRSLGSVPGNNDTITLVDDGTHAVLWAYTNIPMQVFTAIYR